MSEYIQGRRSTLSRLLTGEDSMPGGGDLDIRLYDGLARSIGNVWIIPLEYKSRHYPACETDGNGNVNRTYSREDIPAIVLEGGNGIRKRGKAVVALHQHTREYNLGKSEVAGIAEGKSGNTMKYGLELAKMGYHVICFDFKPFENRLTPHGTFGDYGAERLLKQEATVDGVEPMGMHVLDVMRAVDIMNDQYHIDDVGVIGHSLGGTVVAYSMACDERIKAGVSNCGVATFGSIGKDSIIHNWAWPVHGIKKDFGEFHKLLELVSPRPLMIISGKDDSIFPIGGAGNVTEWGKGYYKNNPGNLRFEVFDGGHAFQDEMKELAYGFLDEML